MHIGHGHLCVCLCLAAFPHYCTKQDVILGNGRWCNLVVHYWVDLQSVNRFSCYDNIVPNAKCQRVLVLAQCLVNYSKGIRLVKILCQLSPDYSRPTQYDLD